MLITRGFGTWTARFGVRVTAAIDWAKLAGYSELNTADRAAAAHQELRAYLERLAAAPPECAFEVRWCTGPDHGLGLVLLGRVHAKTEAEVREPAAAALALLASVPKHVAVEPFADVDAVTAAFAPFPVHRDGLAEIRRPCVVDSPRRVDAGMRFYLAVPPFGPGPHPWPRLLALLAESRSPAMVSVGLQPVAAPRDLSPLLHSVASRYRELAQPRTMSGGLFSGTAVQPGEPFAQWAAQLYQDGADRLRGTVFRLRVTVASSVPFDLGTADVRRPELPGALAAMLAPVGVGGACAVEAPADPTGRALANEAIGMLGVPSWGGDQALRLPGVAQHLRLLTELADATQAAAAIWLPVPHGPAGFPIVDPDAADMPQGRSMVVDGDLVAYKNVNPPR
jgi:hypothetical protein